MKLKQSTLALAIVAALPFAAQAAPQVTFSAPLAGAEVKGTLSSSRCEVKGSSDVRRVVFWLDGSIQLNTESFSPWNCVLDTAKYRDGAHKLKAVAYDGNGASTAAEIAVTFANGTATPAGYSGTPYTGTPIAAPGTFEAENFDKGGNNVAYRDLTSGNTGGQYRTADSVDIIASGDSAGGGYVVNYFQSGEWLAYTIKVPADGNYSIAIRAANKNITGAGFHAEIDGVDVTGKVAVGSTGSWTSFQWFGKSGVPLKAGTHVLKIVADQQYFDVNQVRIASDGSTPAPSGGTTAPAYSYSGTPFSGTPIAVPKAFEAENFDKGGNNVSYRELTATNFGGQYRTAEPVDIIASSDAAGGGYVVNYFETGEWLAYTLNVPADGNYDISIRAANKSSTGAAFRAEIDGVDVTGKVAVPSTGSWTNFQWVGKSGVPLKAGKRILKIIADQQYFDVNAISVLAPGTTAPSGGTGSINQSPTVSFKAPTTGTQLSGTVNSTTCEVNATDDVKVTRVEFALGSTALAPKTSSPWQCAIDTTKFPDGGYELKAVAYDEQGKSSSTAVSVAVKNAVTSPAPASGSKPSSLLFWSGFEGTTAPGPIVDCYGNGCFQEIVGADSWTGFTWPPKVNNGTARYQMISNSGSNPGPTGIGKYISNQVQTVTGPKGTQTRAMYSLIKESGCCGTDSQGGGSTQTPYHIHPGSDVKEMYISQWVKLQPDMIQKMSFGTWRDLFEVKTTDTDYRIELQIRVDAGQSKAYWMARTDTYVPSHKDFWRVYNKDVPVPVGQWFKLETYFKRSSGSDGRIWMAVNGQKIVDRFGPTMGPNNSPINRIMVNQLYSGGTYPIYQWVDNVQVWSTFPTVSSGDAWYDPPYAPR